MPQTQVWTFQYAVENLLDQHEVERTGLNYRHARRACIEALRQLQSYHDWTAYRTTFTLLTVASQSSSTITYDHCVTPDHEALTRGGWKTHDQLKVGDEILAYDHERETCSWQPIEAIHLFDYEGDVLEVERKGRTVLRCTPNHRIPVWERYGRGHGQPRKFRKKFITARELTKEHTTPLAAPIEAEDCGPLSPRLTAILAWIVTDGTGLAPNKNFSSPKIIQSLKVNGDKCAEIEELVGVKPWVKQCGEMAQYTVQKQDREAIRSVIKDKKDLLGLVCEMGVHQAEAMVHAMLQAEASTSPKNGQKVFTQWGDNKPVAEAFQVACLLAGKATNVSEGRFRCRAFGRDYGIRTRYQCPV